MKIKGHEITIKDGKITVDGKQMVFGRGESDKFFVTDEYSLFCNIGLALQLESNVPVALPVCSVEREEDSKKISYTFEPMSELACIKNWSRMSVYLTK